MGVFNTSALDGPALLDFRDQMINQALRNSRCRQIKAGYYVMVSMSCMYDNL